ncbi:uncharacterized protein LOC126899236 isoform X2 [Daktulosphaira vitifoliae]|uniref:uncharacterized protein LOC126899236 isoform X2 n=1 Tax=Daktulosphaira vitifoliae TaxID=58002 RepID=UPI0021AA3F70|nr:uncharacterized protein LOC126899236 isoform X2 [Daktulosphaira vitifoliae]
MRLLHTYCLFFCFYFIKPSVSKISNQELWTNVGISIHLTNEKLEKLNEETLTQIFLRHGVSYFSKLHDADRLLKIYEIGEKYIYWYIEENDIDTQNHKDINVEFFNNAVKKRNDIMKNFFIGYYHIINDKPLCVEENEKCKIIALIRSFDDSVQDFIFNPVCTMDFICNITPNNYEAMAANDFLSKVGNGPLKFKESIKKEDESLVLLHYDVVDGYVKTDTILKNTNIN